MLQAAHQLAEQLACLTALRRLHLAKQSPTRDCAAAYARGSTGLERMLHSLRQLNGLESLQIAAPYDSVSLSRSSPGDVVIATASQG